jgi:hypothetical protein
MENGPWNLDDIVVLNRNIVFAIAPISFVYWIAENFENLRYRIPIGIFRKETSNTVIVRVIGPDTIRNNASNQSASELS